MLFNVYVYCCRGRLEEEREAVSSFIHVGPRDPTGVIRLGGSYFYPPSCFFSLVNGINVSMGTGATYSPKFKEGPAS